MILTLQCYRCGADYEYVGTSPHPGKCQACGSPCVPPAGSLSILNNAHWESANGLSKVWVYALDEQGRPFEFEVAAQGNRGKLVALRVEALSSLAPPQLAFFHREPDAVSGSCSNA
jgi:hypothetical protein